MERKSGEHESVRQERQAPGWNASAGAGSHGAAGGVNREEHRADSTVGSHFEGEFGEEPGRAARSAATPERHHADQPLNGYGFGDSPLGSLGELEAAAEKGAERPPEPRRKQGRGFEGTHSSREHWGHPAPGHEQDRDARHLGRRSPPTDGGPRPGRGPTHRGRD